MRPPGRGRGRGLGGQRASDEVGGRNRSQSGRWCVGRRVADLGARPQRRLQRGQGGDHLRRVHFRATPAGGDRLSVGVGADDRHPLAGIGPRLGEGKDAAAVLEQNHRVLGGRQCHLRMGSRRGRCLAGQRTWRRHQAIGEHLRQRGAHRRVERRLRERAVVHESDDGGRVERLDEVESGAEGVGGLVHRLQVGSDEPVEPPGTQLGEHGRVRARVDPVEHPVGAHERGHVGVLDDRREGCVVELLQGSLGDTLVELVPVGLLVVGGQVLGVGHHPLRLDALHVGGPHGGGEGGILAVGLEGAAAPGNAGEVQLGALNDVDALVAGFGADQSSCLLGHRGIEAGGHADGGRQLGHPLGVVGDPVGPVGQGQRGDAQRGDAGADVLVGAGGGKRHKGRLLLEGHQPRDPRRQRRRRKEMGARRRHPRA